MTAPTPGPEREPFGTDAVRAAVLAWGAEQERALPWRASRDPWAVWVSEVMAQQTQVARVVPLWQAFLAPFPTVERCAAAPIAEVLRRWVGLGYPRRARDLHAAAGMVSERGEFPATVEGWLELPGVGPYTARAVLSFAFEADVAVVDTNVGRVLARVNGRRLTAREAQHAADAALPAGRSWAWNSAMLDLGALVCTARSPGCGRCPVASVCAWRGGPDVDPAVGSAGVSGRQARFAGSDRQGRGRLMRAMAAAPVALDDLAAVTGWSDDPDRAHRAAESLVRDGLAVWDGAVSGSHGSIRLP